MAEDTKPTKAKKWISRAALFVLVLAVWAAYVVYAPTLLRQFDLVADQSAVAQNVGIFGDMFGALNALFSGLAFAGVILAVLLQSRELELQRKQLKAQTDELEEGRAEQKKQTAAYREQVAALKAQVQTTQSQLFAAEFTQIMETYHNLLDELKQGQAPGRQVIIDRHARFIQTVRGHGVKIAVENLTKNSDMTNYVRYMFWAIRRIASAPQNREEYAGLLRSQLSDHETALLFYAWTECPQDDPVWRSAVDLNFFEYLNPNRLADPIDAAVWETARLASHD